MNKYKYKMKFFSPDEGGGEGGAGGESIAGTGGEISRGAAAFEPIPKTTTGDKEPPSSGTHGAETKEHAEGVPHSDAPSGGFDASKFAKEFGDTLGTTLKPILEKAQPAEEKMSPEEARKVLNIWEPDEQWYARYDNLETRTDAVNEMRDGLVRQADTLSQFRMKEMVDQLRAEVMPHLQQSAQQANAAREERLHTTYPLLRESAMQPLVKAIAQDFVERGQTFKSEQELFKALAGGVEAVLKVNNPDFKLETANGSGQQHKQVEGRNPRSLPVVTPGGSGGTGRRDGGPKVEKPRGMAIFDK